MKHCQVCSSVPEHMSGMCEALGLIPGTAGKKNSLVYLASENKTSLQIVKLNSQHRLYKFISAFKVKHKTDFHSLPLRSVAQYVEIG